MTRGSALTALAAGLATAVIAGCGWRDGGEETVVVTETAAEPTTPPPAPVQVAPLPPPAPSQPSPKPKRRKLARSANGPKLDVIATGLEVPWEIAFLPGGQALITERLGRVRLLSNKRKLKRRPVAEAMTDSTEDNKELVRRFYAEAINDKDLGAVDRLLSEDFAHDGERRGRDG